jgi:hypothetical protein
VEEDIKSIMKKVNDVSGIKESDTGLAPPSRWDLVSDKQMMQEEQPLQVARCTKIINPNTDEAKYVINVKQIAKFVVGLGDKVAPTDIEEGMRVGVDRNKYQIQIPLPPKIDPSVTMMTVEEKPDVTYSDIGGSKEQIEKMREVVELPLLHPEKFVQLGIDPPKGVLCYGPPGGDVRVSGVTCAEGGPGYAHARACGQVMFGERELRQLEAATRREVLGACPVFLCFGNGLRLCMFLLQHSRATTCKQAGSERQQAKLQPHGTLAPASPSAPPPHARPLPAGTGKTLLARAVANRTDACFIRVIGSELVQKYVGEVSHLAGAWCCRRGRWRPGSGCGWLFSAYLDWCGESSGFDGKAQGGCRINSECC